MYTLHYAPDNASLIIRLVLEEARLPYTTALVDRSIRAQDSAAYLRLNPTGLIPALETPHGPMFETGAILLWLSDTHGLGPTPDAPDRGDFLKWLFFISNTLHAELRQLFYADRFAPPGAEAGHHALLTGRLTQHLAVLDHAATQSPALFTAPSLLTIYLATLLRWAALYPEGKGNWFRLADYPTLALLAKALDARPATLTCALAEGLGPTPFSNPSYATPPEGSAT